MVHILGHNQRIEYEELNKIFFDCGQYDHKADFTQRNPFQQGHVILPSKGKENDKRLLGRRRLMRKTPYE